MLFHKKNRNDGMTDAEREAADYNHRQEKLDDKLKNIEQKTSFKMKLSKLKFPTYTKNLVALIIAICLIVLQLTYVLAFMDKVTIAEELSKQLCTTILGVAFVYMIRAYFDTKAEHNNDRVQTNSNKFKKELDRLVNSKVASVLQEVVGREVVIENEDSDTEYDSGDPVEVNEDIPDETSGNRIDEIPMENGEFVDMSILTSSNNDETD